MMTLTSFYSNLIRCYYNREEDYWPINLKQVLDSDDAIKWYGMNWPVELVGKPQSTDAWRKDLDTRFHELSKALHEFRPGPSTTYHRLFQGHPKFASEVCFARFLNSKGIPFRDCYSLRGFLYKDRDISQ